MMLKDDDVERNGEAERLSLSDCMYNVVNIINPHKSADKNDSFASNFSRKQKVEK